MVKFLSMKKTLKRSIFSQNLIRFRKVRGLSQKELAERSGLTRKTIAYYETRVSKPPIDKIEVLANVLKVNINDLLGSKNTKTRQSTFTNLDTRTIKKIELILSLPKKERHQIYSYAESLLFKIDREKYLEVIGEEK